MKKIMSKILALIIALASLVSVFSVMTFAQTTASEVPEDTSGDKFDPAKHLIYNRSYEDGWDPFNGFNNTMGSQSAKIDYEIGDDRQYNYFVRFEHTGNKGKGQISMDYTKNGMMQTNGMFIISLSIKADDACDIGNILSVVLNLETAETPLLLIKGYKLYAFSEFDDYHHWRLERCREPRLQGLR